MSMMYAEDSNLLYNRTIVFISLILTFVIICVHFSDRSLPSQAEVPQSLDSMSMPRPQIFDMMKDRVNDKTSEEQSEIPTHTAEDINPPASELHEPYHQHSEIPTHTADDINPPASEHSEIPTRTAEDINPPASELHQPYHQGSSHSGEVTHYSTADVGGYSQASVQQAYDPWSLHSYQAQASNYYHYYYYYPGQGYYYSYY